MAEYVDKEIAYARLSIFGMNVQKMISELPTANVKEVVYAHWIPIEYPFMNECEDCSNCGYRTWYGNGYNYCPNCGAEISEVR